MTQVLAGRTPFAENDHGWPHWTTPEWYLERVRRVDGCGVGIDFDPCNNAASTTGATFQCGPFDCGDGWRGPDGLAVDWFRLTQGTLIYVNPPYGRELPKWLAKCHEEAGKGATIIALVPARTDTRWFHDFVRPRAASILFHRGRIKFANPPPGAKGSDAPKFPSMTVYWGDAPGDFRAVFGDLGMAVNP